MTESGQVGPYRVLGELGRGGMGVVLRAVHAVTGREVALKLVLAADPDLLRRFEVEARAALRLRHPNLVTVHELGQDRGRPYLVMELIEGESLAARLRREGSLPAREAAAIAAALARGVAHAHEQGVLHRDLKPDNVLLARADGRPLVADFGLARLQGLRNTLTGEVLGSPAWIAPEQAAGRPEAVGPAADVWGLGAVLYHMLVGEPPHRGAGALQLLQAALLAEPAPPRASCPGLDPRLDELVVRCLRRDPAERPGSALELAQALERWLAGGPPGRRARLLVPGGLAVASLALLLGVALRPRPAPLASLAAVPSPSPALPVPIDDRLAAIAARANGGEVAGALDELDELLRQAPLATPGLSGAWRLKANLHEVSGDAAGCEAAWSQALALGADDGQVWSDRGLHLTRQAERLEGQEARRPLLEEGLRALDRALALLPGEAPPWLNRGLTRSLLGDVAGARADLNRSLELDRHQAGAWAQLGLLSALERDDAAALRALDRALEIDPRHLRARLERAGVRGRLGDFEGALHDARLFTRARPDEPTGWHYLAAALEGVGQLKEAEVAGLRAEAAGGEGLARAVELYRRRDLAGCRREAEARLARDPNDRVAWRLLGMAHLQAEDWAGARRAYTQALASAPRDPLLRVGLARAEFHLGEREAAYERVTRLMEDLPRAVDLWKLRGLWRLEDGQAAGAAADLERALQLAPPEDPDRPGLEASLRRARELAGAGR